jgi:methylmalonyl-CoA carboxyltransferase large subunit
MAFRTETTLKNEITELRQRVEKLEALLAATRAVPEAAPAASKQGISSEIVMAISAAVAAYLGKRATIRQIRLTSSNAWSAIGRATIQASHSIVRGNR